MSSPLISVVTPSYNQAPYLETTIKSVLGQDYPHLEYIVVDGGSSDGTGTILDKYGSRLAYCVSERDRGQAHAINKGLERAKGDIVAYLNSDDFYLPGALRSAARYLTLHRDVQMIYGDALRVNATGRIYERSFAPSFDLRRLLRGCYIRQPTVFLRRQLIEHIGPFDESLHRCMDYDYWLRVAGVTQPRRVRFCAAADRFHSGAKSSGPVVDTLREEVSVVLATFQRTGADEFDPDLARSALLPRLVLLAGEQSTLPAAQRSEALGLLDRFGPPTLRELVDVLGGHDAYASSPYISGDATRADVYDVLPGLEGHGAVSAEVVAEARHRLNVLASLRATQARGLPALTLSVAHILAAEPWLLQNRSFLVQTVRGTETGRRLAGLIGPLVRRLPTF